MIRAGPYLYEELNLPPRLVTSQPKIIRFLRVSPIG